MQMNEQGILSTLIEFNNNSFTTQTPVALDSFGFCASVIDDFEDGYELAISTYNLTLVPCSRITDYQSL